MAKQTILWRTQNPPNLPTYEISGHALCPDPNLMRLTKMPKVFFILMQCEKSAKGIDVFMCKSNLKEEIQAKKTRKRSTGLCDERILTV